MSTSGHRPLRGSPNRSCAAAAFIKTYDQELIYVLSKTADSEHRWHENWHIFVEFLLHISRTVHRLCLTRPDQRQTRSSSVPSFFHPQNNYIHFPCTPLQTTALNICQIFFSKYVTVVHWPRPPLSGRTSVLDRRLRIPERDLCTNIHTYIH